MNKICPDCAGRGDHDPGYHGCGGVRCSTCAGLGEVSASGKALQHYEVCPKCNGARRVYVDCPACIGTGGSYVKGLKTS